MKKVLLIFFCAIIISSCDKNYNCVCKSLNTGSDTIVDNVKTTKLGVKGYKQTCIDEETKLKVTNCNVK